MVGFDTSTSMVAQSVEVTHFQSAAFASLIGAKNAIPINNTTHAISLFICIALPIILALPSIGITDCFTC